MQLVCKSCGSSELYLKQKGPNVGAYCNKCDKWIKWIGKKELPMFIRKGFKVHDEHYTAGVQYEDTLENVVPDNSHYNRPQQVSRQQDGFVSKARVDDAPFDTADEDYYDDDIGNFSPIQAGGCMSTSYSDVDTEDKDMKFCPVCSMGTIPLLNEETSRVIIRVTDNVLSVVDRDTGDILAMARVNKCPSCGRQLG